MAKVKSPGCVSVPALCLVFVTLVGAVMMMAPQMVDAKTDPGDIQALKAVCLFINRRSICDLPMFDLISTTVFAVLQSEPH